MLTERELERWGKDENQKYVRLHWVYVVATQAVDLFKSILLAPAKIYALWKMALSGPHGWISVVLEVGKNQLVTFGQRWIREATYIGMSYAIYLNRTYKFWVDRFCEVQWVNESESDTFYFVTPFSLVVLSPYLVWRFYETIGISHIPRCYGN